MDDDTTAGITKYQNGLGIDDKLKLTNGTDKEYFLTDHLGSTIGLTDASGNITEQTSYDSFGNATSNLSTRYQYTGREFDEFTGLYYYRARWYDAQLGRFISEDPIGFAGGDVNLFGYVKNNPQNFVDPFGLEAFDEIRMYTNDLPIHYDKEKEKRYYRCYRNNKFSSLFRDAPYLGNAEPYVELAETGSLVSLSLDGFATTRKFFGPTTNTSTQYASGINMVTKDANRVLGFPRIGGTPLGKYLTPIGNKLTPPLAIFGGFTLGYNETISFQCACGILE